MEQVNGPPEGQDVTSPNADAANKTDGASSTFGQTMPEIVVHPCDGTPCFSPAAEEWSVITISTSLPTTEQDISEVSIATTPETNRTDGSYSEPETPFPATPLEESFSLPMIALMETLQVPIDSMTAAHDEDQAIAVNVSNVSGQKFVLTAPPPPTRFVPGRGKRADIGPRVGLGFVSSRPAAESLSDLDDISEDDESTGSPELPCSAFSSDGSVGDLVSALENVASDSAKCVPVEPAHAHTHARTHGRCASSGSISSDASAADATHGCSRPSLDSQSTWDSNDPLSERLTRLIRAFATPSPGAGDSDEDGERVLGDASVSEEDFFECSADLEAWIGIEEAVGTQRVACGV